MATAWSLLHPHFTALTRQPAMADLMNLNRKNKRTLFWIYACIIYKLDIRVFKAEIYGKSRTTLLPAFVDNTGGSLFK